ncbi:transport and golgi organization protein [Acrasis kona]|uniref:Transport and golgi organization protein n=1 Tax=Acrasis kona TaxID=1008807 RepID=A0AAW2ZHN8_9EUKA
MCILAFAVNVHPEFPIVIIDNRDEITKRPTKDAELEKETQIICGRDMTAGGTWCGIHSKTGQFAVLTNVYEPTTKKNLTSRGKLVDLFIKGNSADSKNILSNWTDFMGYNLLFGNVKEFLRPNNKEQPCLYFASNRTCTFPTQPVEPTLHKLHDGVHCVSNSFLNDESWPKVKYLREELEKALKDQNNANLSAQEMCDQLSHLLTCRPLFPLDQIKQHIIDQCNSEVSTSGEKVITSPSDEIMKIVQNVFVDYKNEIKTRSQTIMLVHKSGSTHYFYRNTDEICVDVPLLLL